ncbi:hypothetical protein BDZ45DRAFT_682532 [Acephala macrosclerotiorum]|nr:hypothetical protein BDZ45DRAFT_682532 [Acephala macrosclerotiorum]
MDPTGRTELDSPLSPRQCRGPPPSKSTIPRPHNPEERPHPIPCRSSSEKPRGLLEPHIPHSLARGGGS